jgi:hypothetical protein
MKFYLHLIQKAEAGGDKYEDGFCHVKKEARTPDSVRALN